MNFAERRQLIRPYKIATVRQQGYLLETVPSCACWFIHVIDDRCRPTGLSYHTIEPNTRDYDWMLAVAPA